MQLRTIALSVSYALISINALANTTDIKSANNQVGIQYQSTNVDYTETGNGVLGAAGVTLDTENGSVPGYGIFASVMKDLWLGNDYFAAEYDHASGSTNYVGSLQGGTYGSVVQSDSATLANYSLRYGKGFVVNNSTMLTPFAEVGHHKWDRGVNTGEDYSNHYFGAGVLAQYSPVSKLVLSANALLGYTFGSYITVNAIPSANFAGFAGGLGNSPLYRVGAGADYALTQQIHANIGIDYTSFKYGASAIYSGYGEPDSKTNYTTVKVGIGYAF
jgi:opacity protein-like surface antigen